MSVTTTNLIQGPGTLYIGAFGATEPAETAVGLAGDPSTGWTDVGGTTDGVSLTIAQDFAVLEVDQIVDTAGRRLTKRDVSLKTNLAEPTLNNLAYAMNSTPGASAVINTSQSGVSKLSPTSDTSATQPTYSALILDGFAPAQLRRRVVVRKVLSTDNVEFAYTKDKQTVFSVTWSAHYVSNAIKPFVVLDATS